jgi:5'(3')-deoxyribonucleotidase
MKITEVTKKSMPHLYLDMDGVQADFFQAWADFENVHHYSHIADHEAAIVRLAKTGPENVYKFFRDLKPLSGGNTVVQWLKKNNIPFTVLSAPIRMEPVASIRGKREWLDEHNPGTSKDAIFTSAKYKYATAGGQPNVLVDDFSKYLDAWTEHGGIAVKHSDETTANTIQQLEKIYAPFLTK